MPEYNPYFTRLETCPSSEQYVDKGEVRHRLKPGKGKLLKQLVKGARYQLFCCRPVNFYDPAAGFHHVDSTFIFRGFISAQNDMGQSLTVVIMDVGDHEVGVEAHVLGLAPFDGWGEDVFYDSLGIDWAKYLGKWNHFSCVISAP
ncbi:MAG TPA: hypothetical protein VD907_03425 [Verrucomicrobiae bacterium]|nr:hypothetical protein [Verrucomicrobiae bacterium]